MNRGGGKRRVVNRGEPGKKTRQNLKPLLQKAPEGQGSWQEEERKEEQQEPSAREENEAKRRERRDC